MNMLASVASNDRPLLDLKSKPMPKPRKEVKSNFTQVLNAASGPREKVTSPKGENTKMKVAEGEAETKLKQVEDFMEKNRDKLDIPDEVNEKDLIAIINSIMDEMGIEDLSDMDAESISYFNAELTKLLIQNQDLVREEITHEVRSTDPKNMVKNEPVLTLIEDQVKETSDAKKANNRLITSKVDSLGPMIRENTSKESTNERPQSFKANNLTMVKTSSENQTHQTDIKKLINNEISKFNNLKPVTNTTMNEELTTKQTVATSAEEDEGLNLNLNRNEVNQLRTENRTVLVNNKPVEVKEIIDQIVRKAELVLRQNASEIKINLKPEFLGKLTIKVAVEQGIVTARFLTENMQVKHLLESNLNTLRQSLENQGIRVERAEVNVQLNNGGMFDGSEGSKEWEFEKSEFAHYLPSGEIEDDFLFESEPGGFESQEGIEYYQEHEENSLSFLI